MSEIKIFVTEQISGISGRVDQIYSPNIERTNSEIDQLKAQNEVLRSAQEELSRLKNLTIVNPHWPGRKFPVDEKLCFLLMPFGETWSEGVWKTIDTIISSCGMRCERADQREGRVIMHDIWEGICSARVVIADITGGNPNVTYEVGMADVLGKEIILLAQNPASIPFDFEGIRLILYKDSFGGPRQLTTRLKKRLKNLRSIDA